jgi:hypothetical protein
MAKRIILFCISFELFNDAMTRKTMHITLTLALALSLLGVGMVPASYSCGGTCCCRMQAGMARANSQRGPEGLSGPANCCCNRRGAARDFSQECALNMSDFPDVAVPRAGDSLVPATDMVTNNIELSPALSEGFSQKVWTVGAGPPLPLFLFNQSFLC